MASFAARSDLRAKFWPVGQDQKQCVQITSATTLTLPSSPFPVGTGMWGATFAHAEDKSRGQWRCVTEGPWLPVLVRAQQAQMACVTPILDPNISKVKELWAQWGPYICIMGHPWP